MTILNFCHCRLLSRFNSSTVSGELDIQVLRCQMITGATKVNADWTMRKTILSHENDAVDDIE